MLRAGDKTSSSTVSTRLELALRKQPRPDLSTVNIARYSANFIPRNPAVLADVDDINNNVWVLGTSARLPHS